jgi:hypothetical protein
MLALWEPGRTLQWGWQRIAPFGWLSALSVSTHKSGDAIWTCGLIKCGLICPPTPRYVLPDWFHLAFLERPQGRSGFFSLNWSMYWRAGGQGAWTRARYRSPLPILSTCLVELAEEGTCLMQIDWLEFSLSFYFFIFFEWIFFFLKTKLGRSTAALPYHIIEFSLSWWHIISLSLVFLRGNDRRIPHS